MGACAAGKNSRPCPLIGVLQQALSELSARRLDVLHGSLSELLRTMKVKDVRARATPLSDM